MNYASNVLSCLPPRSRLQSTSPRVFDILNVFTKEEADELVARALAETSPSHRIKRSTTGTSENSIYRCVLLVLFGIQLAFVVHVNCTLLTLCYAIVSALLRMLSIHTVKPLLVSKSMDYASGSSRMCSVLSHSFLWCQTRRIFELLGFDEYWDGHDDGLQILRYNESTAYIQHMDYLQDKSDKELYVRFHIFFFRLTSSFLLMSKNWL